MVGKYQGIHCFDGGWNPREMVLPFFPLPSGLGWALSLESSCKQRGFKTVQEKCLNQKLEVWFRWYSFSRGWVSGFTLVFAVRPLYFPHFNNIPLFIWICLRCLEKIFPTRGGLNFLMVMNPMVDLSFTVTEGANPSLRLRSKVPWNCRILYPPRTNILWSFPDVPVKHGDMVLVFKPSEN